MRPLFARSITRRFLPIIVGIFAGLVGCTKEEPITTYTVKKHELIQIPISTPGTDSAAGAPQEIAEPTDRILAALILDDAVAWYFKGSAPVSAFPAGAAEKFDTFLTTLKFENSDKPSWEIGEDWEELPGSGMRVANLVLGEVTFSVIKLEIPPGDERKYIVENINRWRRQVSLGPVTSSQLSNLSHKIKTADGHSATVVDILGKSDAGAMPPMAGGFSGGRPAGGQAAAPSVSAPAASSVPQFESQPPENWQSIPAGTMNLAKYQVQDGDKSAVISVSTAGGSIKMNVDRWRGQLGLPPTESEDEINAEPVTVSDLKGLRVRITGENDESIIVSMVPSGSSVWFFKMHGATSLVEKESPAYEKFLSTIRLN